MTDQPRKHDGTDRRAFLWTIGAAGLATGTLVTTAAASDGGKEPRTLHDLTGDERPDDVDSIATRTETEEFATSAAAEPVEETIDVKNPRMAVRENRSVVEATCKLKSNISPKQDVPVRIYEKRTKDDRFKRLKRKFYYSSTQWTSAEIKTEVDYELRSLLYTVNGRAYNYDKFPDWK